MVIGSMGLFHLFINGGWIGVKKSTDPITIDPFTSWDIQALCSLISLVPQKVLKEKIIEESSQKKNDVTINSKGLRE